MKADDARAPRTAVLWAIALAGCAAAACVVWLAVHSDHVEDPGLQAALVDWMVLPYIFAGLIAWRRRPASRFGPLMVAAGFAVPLAILGWANAPVPFTLGQTLDVLPLVMFLHVFLAFPSGRVEGRFARALVVVAYAIAVGGVLVRGLLGEFGPRYLFEVIQAPEAATAARSVQLFALSACCLVAIAVLAARRRGAGRPRRRSVALLVESFALGLAMIALLLVAGDLSWPVFETIRRATYVVIGIAPVAFLIGLLDVRLARSSLADLLVGLQANPAPAALRDAIADAVCDPTVELAYWLEEYDSYVDLEGRPVQVPRTGGDRATTPIERDGAHIAALVHDPSLVDEPELLEAVCAAAGIALENAQLHAELRARLDELRGSRVRIVEAGQRERQRLERNLHDGAQQRLVALALELGRLEERLGDDADARVRLEQARQEIASSLEELRDVARGLHPAVVSGHGLAVALESLAAHGPVPVQLDVALEDRLPEPLEVAAYYVVSESLANIGKHAHATAASVQVARANGHVVVEVTDDGIGGADSERGTGLRGLADRIEALDGRLRVWTPRGGGTRVRAELPCAS